MWEIVEQLMERKGVKASDMAKETGISQSIITDWKKGRCNPKADKLYALAKYFDVPMEVFFGEGELPPPQTPMYNAAAGEGCFNDVYATEFVPDGNDEGCTYCRVYGDSMLPVIRDGDIAKVQMQTEVSPHDYAVVKVDGEHATIKHIQITGKGVWLKAENKDVYEDRFFSVQEVMTLPVTIIGKVIEIRRLL